MTDLEAVTLSGKPDDFVEVSGGDGGWMIIDPQNPAFLHDVAEHERQSLPQVGRLGGRLSARP